MFKDTYLHILWLKNRKLFYIICACILLTLFTNLSRNEITPFYVWSMYSAKTLETDTFPIFTMQYNIGNEFTAPHTWKDHKRMMFFYTIDYYTSLLDNNGEPDAVKMANGFKKIHLAPTLTSHIYNTQQQISNYPAWLKQYMESDNGIKIDSMSVYRKWLKYSDSGHIYTVKSELIFKQ